MSVLDASGKFPEGILSGTLSSLGAYDECLDTMLGDEEEDHKGTNGQYCSIDIKPFLPPKPPSNSLDKIFNDAADAKGFPKKDHLSRLAPVFYFLKFRLGVCIPSTCSTSDLKTITDLISLKIRLNVTATRCEIKESYNAGLEQVIAGAAILSVISIVLVATIADIIRRYVFSSDRLSGSDTDNLSIATIRISRLKSLLYEAWTSFSVYANCQPLLTTSVQENSITCLYGLKVLNLIWIILAHSYLTLDLKAVGQLLQTQKVNSNFLFQVVMNASLAVETFFFISGIVVTLSVLRRLTNNPDMKFGQWVWFYVHRLIRMTPAVILVIAIVLSAYQLSDGPLWREIIYPSAERCRKNWWIHFLHISNFFDVSRMVSHNFVVCIFYSQLSPHSASYTYGTSQRMFSSFSSHHSSSSCCTRDQRLVKWCS